jgi:hypothetical protein
MVAGQRLSLCAAKTEKEEKASGNSPCMGSSRLAALLLVSGASVCSGFGLNALRAPGRAPSRRDRRSITSMEMEVWLSAIHHAEESHP